MLTYQSRYEAAFIEVINTNDFFYLCLNLLKKGSTIENRCRNLMLKCL